MKRYLCEVFIFMLSTLTMVAENDNTALEKVGNFLLPSSQQAGPLYGFGQNIIDKGNKQFFINMNQLFGRCKNLSLPIPGFLYGIQNNLSLFIFLPVVAHARDGCNRSHGVSDLWLQLEYAYINKATEKTVTQATLVTSLLLPSGSAKKNPNTGNGLTSFFLGGTFSYTTQWWAIWFQPGGLLTTKHHCTKFGNTFLYQFGIEKCFAARNGWIIAGMVEGLGIYSVRDKIQGLIDPNSGGNTFWIAPSLFASSAVWLFQLGIAGPAVQHLNGIQNKYSSYLNLNIGYKF